MTDFMERAREVAGLAECKKRSVGAVVVWQGEEMGIGYNGYEGISSPGCLEGGCLRGENGGSKEFPCIALHAEERAVIKSGLAACSGADLYVTHRPCENCQRFCFAAGISQIFWCDLDGRVRVISSL